VKLKFIYQIYILIFVGVLNKTVKISIVNYTNTLPFKWALKKSELLKEIDLQEDIPSICAQKLQFKQVDIALVPVALLAELDQYEIVSDYCIGADGIVDSVKLYSNVPFDQIEIITLDYQSRSSIALTKILCEHYWRIQPKFENAKPGFESHLQGKNANVVIGDRTFDLNACLPERQGKFKYEYDLAETWKAMTGLPFVFAAWVSTEKIDEGFIKKFNAVLKEGIENIAVSVNESSELKISKEKALDYLTKKISYDLDEQKRKGMDLFLRYLSR
jgi:chorismate dehydratase